MAANASAPATSAKSKSGLRGRTKAAALLIALGPDLSAQVLKHMPEAEIERLTYEVYSLGSVAPDTRAHVMTEVFNTVKAEEYISIGGIEYATQMLEKALGAQKAHEIVGRITASTESVPFSFLREVDPVMLLNFLQREHPQTIALVVSHLPPERAAEILQGLSPEMQAEVSVRIATMSRTVPDVVREVEGVLRKKLATMISPNREFTEVGGLDTLVGMLKQVDRGTEKTILDSLERSDPRLADEIKKQMFVFDNITLLDDRSIQRVLREVDMKDLGLALKGTTDEVRERIFRNMSERAGQMLEEDMAAHGPVRLRQVEEAQGRIVSTIRKLDDAEEIVISRGGEDDILV